MNKTEFLNLLDKHIDCKTTLQEDELLNNYYSSFQDPSSMSDEKRLMNDEELGDKILAKINKRIDSAGTITL